MIRPWILWTMAAVVQWAVWSLLSRSVESTLNAVQTQTISTLGMLPVLAWLTRSTGTFAASKENHAPTRRARHFSTGAALAAGLFTSLGNMAYYHALSLDQQISATVSLSALYPMVTVLLAMLFLGERLGFIQWIGMILSLAAMTLLNVDRRSALWSPALGYTLVPILSWGLAGLLQKVATQNMSGKAATFWFLAAFVPVGLGLALRITWPPHIPPHAWTLGGLIGLVFAGGNLALLMAYEKQGKASIIAPIASLYPALSIPAAIGIFSENITPLQWTGIGLALLAALSLSIESPSPPHTPATPKHPPHRQT